MSRQIEIAEYKKKIADLTRQINAVQAQKEELLLALQNLNISYQQGRIGYLEYSHKWAEILANRPVEEYINSYDRQLYELAVAKKSYSAKVREAEGTERKRAHSITLAASIMIILAIVAGFGMLSFEAGEITGAATDVKTTKSNATIQVYISIARSDNLTDGIEFGDIDIGAIDINATDNYKNGSRSALFIALSSDSNTNVDFCIKANEDLMNNSVIRLGIGNMTWNYSTTTDSTSPPGPDNSTSMNKTYYGVGDTSITPGSNEYYRFWLDIPSDQAAGAYNNTVEFRVVQTGTGC